jgi:flagellar hook-associated protein 1 FlgK
MNEELADMLRYQHGYNAAARFISTVNSMLDTLINRMGV